MDGGTGDDSMAGDNAIIWRRGDDLSPRFRYLTEDAIYTTTGGSITANVTGAGTGRATRPTRSDGTSNWSIIPTTCKRIRWAGSATM